MRDYDDDVYGQFGYGIDDRGNGDLGYYGARRLRTNCFGDCHRNGNLTAEEWRRWHGSMDFAGAGMPGSITSVETLP